MRQGGDPDLETVIGCARTKLAVVAEDERDAGRRQVLNLGHTVAHAIEAATGYARYRHGEAVGIGLLAALRLSGREALRAEVAELLGARGLPARFGGAGVDEVVALVERDKKRIGGRVPFVLVEAPGEVTPGTRGGARRPARGGGGGARGMSGRVEVIHGVNLDVLGRRDPAHYGSLTLTELEVQDQAVRRRARPGRGVLPDEPRGRVLRVAPPRRRDKRTG